MVFLCLKFRYFQDWSLYEITIPVGDKALQALFKNELPPRYVFRSSGEDRHQPGCSIRRTVLLVKITSLLERIAYFSNQALARLEKSDFYEEVLFCGCKITKKLLSCFKLSMQVWVSD